MAKLTLDIEYEYDFNLIGISCHQKVYKLCWAINKNFSLNLKKIDDYFVEQQQPNTQINCIRYEYIDEKSDLQYWLIENKGNIIQKNGTDFEIVGAGLLVPEMKYADYFLVLKGNFFDHFYNNIISELKNISFILTAFNVEVESLKSKNNFLIE